MILLDISQYRVYNAANKGVYVRRKRFPKAPIDEVDEPLSSANNENVLSDLASQTMIASRHRKSRRDRDYYWGYLFIAPALLGSICFMFLPAITSVIIAFLKWDFVGTPIPVGISNFKTVFSDPFTWTIIRNTLYYMLLNIPAVLFTATTDTKSLS